MDKQSICNNKRNWLEFIGFKTKSKSFEDTIDFCTKVLSGKIATSTEKEVLKDIEKEANNMGITIYYNGFIRNQLNSSTFLEYSSKRPMPSSSWLAGQPNNYGNNQNCVTNVVNNGLNDMECTTALNPVCQVKLNTHFQLTGIPKSMFADDHYLLGEVRGFKSAYNRPNPSPSPKSFGCLSSVDSQKKN